MFNRAKLNLVVDAKILWAFLATVLSGLLLLIAPHSGYQAGRNSDVDRTVLCFSRDNWSDIHVWGGLSTVAGIVMQVALHWGWIVCTLRKVAPLGGGELRWFCRNRRRSPLASWTIELCLSVAADCSQWRYQPRA